MGETQIVEMKAQPWAYISRLEGLAPHEIGAAVDAAFDDLTERFARGGVRACGAPRARYHYQDNQPIGFDLGFPIEKAEADAARRAGLTTGEALAGPALTTIHRGAYEEIAQSYKSLQQDLAARRLSGAGAVWEVYLNDPDVTAQSELLTQIYWPIASTVRDSPASVSAT
ncbi:MAG TPA: GyrI-like domain-containing protein [Caulobacterales bacterium]|nr:GyrI-like domain-containing protein [Caulobacterales bacterium]